MTALCVHLGTSGRGYLASVDLPTSPAPAPAIQTAALFRTNFGRRHCEIGDLVSRLLSAAAAAAAAAASSVLWW